MIRVRKRYAIIGGDFSGQEPRSLCAFAQDKDMQEAYQQQQDLYAKIASKCYHNEYEDNLEFKPVKESIEPCDAAVDIIDHAFTVNLDDELETPNGWKYAKDLSVNDEILVEDEPYFIALVHPGKAANVEFEIEKCRQKKN